MRHLRFSLMLLPFLLSFFYLNSTMSLPVCCAGTSWQAVGPFAGTGWIVIDPASGTLYAAGLTGGVFTSLNGGASWTDITNGLPYTAVVTDLRLAVDEATKKTALYAVLSGIGVYKLADGGATWSLLARDGLQSLDNLSSIGIDSTNSNIVYLASNSTVYKSTDGGSSWNTILRYDFELPVVVLADSETIYIGDLKNGVVKSFNGGTTWYYIRNGLGGKGVKSIAIDSASSETLYAITVDNEVYRSTNGGSSWSAFSGRVPPNAIGPRLPVIYDPSNFQIAYQRESDLSGFLKSCDGGSTWKRTTAALPAYVNAVAVHPSISQTILAGTYNGLYKSEDGGSSWRNASKGLSFDNTQFVYAVAIASNGLESFLSTDKDIFRSTDRGENWTPVTASGSGPKEARSIILFPTSGGGNIIYATSPYGVFKSSDDGAAWNSINNGLDEDATSIVSLAVDPTNASIVYAVGDSGWLYQSVAGGGSWNSQVALLPVAYSVAVSKRRIDGNSIVYAGTDQGIFISNDAGQSWNDSNPGLPIDETGFYVNNITIDPTDSSILYAWVRYQKDDEYQEVLYKSIDSGRSWKEFSSRFPGRYSINNFAVDAVNKETLYAATFGGVIRSITESAPAISVPAFATFSIGIPGSLHATTSRWPAPTISVSGPIPNGLVFDPSSSILSGTPSVGSAGSYQLTFTASTGIPPDASRTVAINVLPSPGSLKVAISPFTSPLASLSAISGTASGTGLTKVEVQVTDGTYYLQSDSTLGITASSPWLSANGTSNWSLNTLAVKWVEGVTYTITVRASSSDAQAQNSGSFRIKQNSAKQGVILSASATPDTIRADDTAAIRGSLTKADLTPLDRQTITVIVTPPSTKEIPFPPKVITSHTTDATGAFRGPSVQYTTPGVYSVEVRFNGTGTLQTGLVNVSLPVVASSGYAIIVVGKTSDDSLLDEAYTLLDMHTKTATAVYNSLRTKRGFVEGNIKLLISSSNTAVTKQQIRDALTSIKTKYASSPAPVYLIMIDHGNESGFLLGGTTSDLILSPSELSLMLDEFERDVPAQTLANHRRFLIMGSCFSGLFQSIGSKPGRVVLTSAAANERSLAGSTTSAASSDRGGDLYIDALFNYLDRGDSFANAHVQAVNNVTFSDPRNYNGSVTLALHSGVVDTEAQHPLLNDNGDSTGSFRLDGGTDGRVTANLFLGEGKRVPSTGDPADIVATSPTLFLGPTTNAASGQGGIWLKVKDSSHVSQTSVDIRTPDTYVETTPGTGQVIPGGLDSLPLTFDGEKWIDLTNHAFEKSGRYDIYYNVINTENQPSPMAHSKVYKNKPSNTAPDPFTLKSPLNGTVNPSFPLSWTASADSDGLSYTLLVSTDGPTPASFDSRIIYAEEDIPQPQTYLDKDALKDPAGGYYCRTQSCYWKVRAVDGYGMTTESDNIGSFKIVDTNVGQTKIYGYVYNAHTRVPVVGATIIKDGIEYKTVENGNFLMSAETAAEHVISVKADGYEPASARIVTSDDIVKVDLGLMPVGRSQVISITTPAPANAEYGTQFTVVATAPGGAVIYSSASPSICTNSGGTFTMIASSGTCIVQFDQGGGSNYGPAPGVTSYVTAAKRRQSITGFAPPPSMTYGDAAIQLSAYATSGLPVTFAVVSGPAIISNNLLSITGAGTITVKAGQGGDVIHAPATDVVKVITANKAPLTVTAVSKSRPYNAPNPTFIVDYSGFINNDTAAVLTGSPSLSTAAVQSSPPGSYLITVTQGSLESVNYSFTFVNGILNVLQNSMPPGIIMLMLL